MKTLLLTVLFTLSMTSLAQTQSKALIAKGPGCPVALSSDGESLGVQKISVEEEVLKAEREQRDAYLRRDIKATERLVADEFVLTVSNGIGSKATLLTFLREEPADPTLTLTTADVQVRVNGDTAIVSGKRIEKRRSPVNNQEGVAYARYSRTYVKRPVKDAAGIVGPAQWQLLSEQLQTIPSEPVAIRVDPKIYDDYIGKYDNPILPFSVTKDGDRLMAIPDDKRRPAAELFPESETEFFLKGRDVQITFIRDRKGQVTHALVRLNGAPIRARRIG
jgi:ketosteroid isomerase-like protein